MTDGFAPDGRRLQAIDVVEETIGTRALDWAVPGTGAQKLGIGASSTSSTAIPATEVLLHATVDCFFTVGSDPLTAANAAGSLPLLAGEKFTLRITSGQKVAVIRNVSSGDLFILPVA
jgi:hypothetical protein